MGFWTVELFWVHWDLASSTNAELGLCAPGFGHIFTVIIDSSAPDNLVQVFCDQNTELRNRKSRLRSLLWQMALEKKNELKVERQNFLKINWQTATGGYLWRFFLFDWCYSFSTCLNHWLPNINKVCGRAFIDNRSRKLEQNQEFKSSHLIQRGIGSTNPTKSPSIISKHAQILLHSLLRRVQCLWISE